MASVDSNSIVSYEDLKTYVLQKISQNCCNIDKLPNPLPDDINPLSERNIKLGSQTLKLKIIDSGNVIKQVKSSTVKSQFESFLDSRGLKNKPNIPISSKAMLNLFNNITIFISCRTKIYKTTDVNASNKIFVFYDDSDKISYDKAPYEFRTDDLKITDSPGEITKQEVRKSVQSLIKQINKTNEINAAAVSIRCVCSSSSSCSSSSCSSSCCSSSSSSFIVYMLI